MAILTNNLIFNILHFSLDTILNYYPGSIANNIIKYEV